VIDPVLMYRPDIPNTSAWVERVAYRDFWYEQGWRSNFDPYVAAAQPSDVIDSVVVEENSDVFTANVDALAVEEIQAVGASEPQYLLTVPTGLLYPVMLVLDCAVHTSVAGASCVIGIQPASLSTGFANMIVSRPRACPNTSRNEGFHMEVLLAAGVGDDYKLVGGVQGGGNANIAGAAQAKAVFYARRS
jgi:hypothetical protein